SRDITTQREEQEINVRGEPCALGRSSIWCGFEESHANPRTRRNEPVAMRVRDREWQLVAEHADDPREALRHRCAHVARKDMLVDSGGLRLVELAGPQCHEGLVRRARVHDARTVRSAVLHAMSWSNIAMSARP